MVWPFGKRVNPYAAPLPGPAREALIRERIVAMAEEEFPDDTGKEWPILGFEHQGHLTFVEVEPKPAMAGSPRFKLVVSFAGEPKSVATYRLKDGRYTLLNTVHGLKDPLPKVLA